MTNYEQMAEQMYSAYCQQAGGLTFDGKPLPLFSELGLERQSCWKAVAEAMAPAKWLRVAPANLKQLADSFPELNLSNYGAEDVDNLHNWALEVVQAITALDHAAAPVVLPKPIQDLIEAGELIQWRRHPTIFFVEGVGKARIIWDSEKGIVAHRYLRDIPKDQYPKFRDVFNKLSADIAAQLALEDDNG